MAVLVIAALLMEQAAVLAEAQDEAAQAVQEHLVKEIMAVILAVIIHKFKVAAEEQALQEIMVQGMVHQETDMVVQV